MDDNSQEEVDNANFSIETKLSKDKRMECRNIVKTIKEFGVSQRQILYLIQLLTYELEDRDVMTSIIDSIKQNREKVSENMIQLSEDSSVIIT